MIIETKYDIGDVVRFEYYHNRIIAGEIIGISIIPFSDAPYYEINSSNKIYGMSENDIIGKIKG